MIIQYGEIEHTGGGFIHTTLKQSRKDEKETQTFKDMILVERAEQESSSELVYVRPISSKTLRGASASSCSRSACSMAFSTFFFDVS